MVSLELQKQHLGQPFHFLLIRLSLVSVTPFFRNQRKILILRGTRIFQAKQLDGVPSLSIKFRYIDFTVYLCCLFRFHTKISFSLLSSMLVTFPTSSIHCFNLSPDKPLLKEILRGVELSILATVSSFLLTMLDGYISLSVLSLIHTSSQNLT